MFDILACELRTLALYGRGGVPEPASGQCCCQIAEYCKGSWYAIPSYKLSIYCASGDGCDPRPSSALPRDLVKLELRPL